MKKKLLSVLMTAAMVMSMMSTVAYASDVDAVEEAAEETEETTEETEPAGDYSDKKVGLVTCVGGLGDHSLGDNVYAGVVKAQEELGFQLDYSEPMQSSEMEGFIRNYCTSGDYDLIVVAGYEAIDPVTSLSEEFPDQMFYGWDINLEGIDNFATGIFDHSQISFVSGAMAALVDELGTLTVNGKEFTWEPSGKLGLVIGTEVPSTIVPMAAYEAGAKYVNPDIEVEYGQVGSWNDPTKGKEVGLSMYDQGVQTIYANAGGSAMGILDAAEESDAFLFGFDTDYTVLDAEHVYANGTNLNANVISKAICDYLVDGTFAGGTCTVCGVDTGDQEITIQENTEIPDEIMETVNAIYDQVKNHEIEIPTTFEDAEAFSETYSN